LLKMLPVVGVLTDEPGTRDAYFFHSSDAFLTFGDTLL
jgi:hypothetical protein